MARPVTTLAAVAAVLLLGAVTLPQLPVALLPALEVPALTIRTRVPGGSAADIARTVAVPLEQALSGLPGLEGLRTVSRTGEATTTVTLRWGSDMRRVVWMARERLDAARVHLPAHADRPTLLTSDPGARPVAVLAMTGAPSADRERGRDALVRMAQTVYAPRLEQLPGIAQVVVTGAPRRELAVRLDPDRLRIHGLTATLVAAALREQNVVGAGGVVRQGGLRVPVHAATEFRRLEEVRDAPVGEARGRLRVRDLGTVQFVRADPETQTRLDGVEAIGLVVYKDAGANTLTVASRLDAELERLRRAYPAYAPTVVATQAEFIRAALDNLGLEIAVGALLSLLLILAVLRDWRLAGAIGLVVPLAVLSAVVFLRALGVGINVLSLGGLALGTGLLVDTAIVVIEAVRRRQEAGVPMPAAAVQGASLVAAPLLAGTLTTVLVFGPVLLINGLAAALFRDLALSVVITSLTSLGLALTLLPVLLAGGARRGPATSAPSPAVQATGGPRWSLDAVIERQERAVTWALDHPRPMGLLALGLMGATGWLLGQLPREILPPVEDGVVVAQVALPAGTPLASTTRTVARIERTARALGVTRLHARVGVATDEELLAGADAGSTATARLLLPVPVGTAGSVLVRQLRDALRDLVAAGHLTLDPGGHSEFATLFGRDARALRVLVRAPTDAIARVWSDSVRRWLAPQPSLVEVRAAHDSGQPVVALTLRRERLAPLGLEAAEVTGSLRGLLQAVPASVLHATDDETPLQVQTGTATTPSLRTALHTPVGGHALSSLVDYTIQWEPVVVERIDQQPVRIVDAQVASTDLAGVSRQVATQLEARRARQPPPPGVSWQVAGAETDRAQTSRQLRTVAGVALVLVYLVLAAEFGSVTVPLVILLTVPLAGAGALLALAITGQSLNAVSLIGVVVLIGMVDNEAVVKLDAIRREQAAGWPLREAVRRGSRARVRAILLTAFTTMLGVLPLLGMGGRGAALYRPLAATLVGGVLMGWVVTSYLLPAVYLAVDARRGRA